MITRNLRGFVGVAVGASLLLSFTSPLAAQGDSGSLRGRIVDGTGAALPGVTIVAASPAVMGGSVTAVTSGEGVYRFPSLPPGLYELRMDLSGFTPTVVRDVRINVGVALTVDRALQVATVQEAVTVVGEAPIVDVKNTSGDTTVGRDVLERVPSSRDLWNTLQQVPGLIVPRENVGGFESTQLSPMSVHGSGRSAVQHNINGLDMTLMHQDNLGAGYFSTDTFEEVQVTTSGVTAEHSRGGLIINQVVKSGSNRFRGLFSSYYENSSMQADNIDDGLRTRGVTTGGAPLDRLIDVSAQLGGPVLRDRLWFFHAYRKYDVYPYVLNCSNTDGSQCTNESKLLNFTTRVDTQANPSHRFMFLHEYGKKLMPNRDISQFVRPEASWYQDGGHTVWQGKYNWVATGSTLVEVSAGALETPFPLSYRSEVGNATSAFDEITRVRYDAPVRDFLQKGQMQTYSGNVTYFNDRWLGATHDIKAGLEHRRGQVPETDRRNGDLERRYQNGVPYRVIVYNTPITRNAHNQSIAGYIQDSMRLGRVTLNAGVRAEWWRADLPEQTNEPAIFANVFGGRRTFPEQKGLMEWTTISPRAGVAWDIAGDSRTVVKATAGRYFSQIEGNQVNNTANANRLGSATFDWVDLNGNNYPDYPHEFTRLISRTLPGGNTIAPGLKSPYSDELTAGVERRLGQSLAVSARYTYRTNRRIMANTDLALPPSAFSIPSTAADPLTGNIINYWSLAPQFRGITNDIVLAQFDENKTRYHGVDVNVDRRFDGRWMVRLSFTLQDNYGRVGGFMDRNDMEIFPEGAAGFDAKHLFRVLGTYILPWDINAGWAFRSTGGMNSFTGGTSMARTVQVRDVTTNSLYNVRVEPNGSYRQDAVNVLDLRASKVFRISGHTFEAMIDAFNVLNANNVLQASTITGPTFDRPTHILPPRVARLGIKYTF